MIKPDSAETKKDSIYPAYKDKIEKIKLLRNKIKKNNSTGRQNFEKDWYRNVLFYSGMQWISFSTTSKKWGKAKLDYDWIPTPVTNKFAAAVNTIKSIITQRIPRITIRPNTNSEEDVATAEIGDSITDVLDKEAQMEDVRKSAAPWLVITGNVFAYSYYDTSDEHGVTEIEMDQCKECRHVATSDEFVTESEQACPECQSQDIGPAMDAQANRLKISYPKGRLTTEVKSPFEVFFNGDIQDFYKVREVVLSKSVPVDEMKRRYPEFKDQIIPTAGSDSQLSEYYLSSLAYVTSSSVSGNTTTPGTSVSGERIEKNIMDEVFAFPSDDFEDGLYAVFAGDVVVEAGPLWSKDYEGKYFMPVAFAGGIKVPGKPWHKSPVDDLVKKQLQRNKFESLAELGILRMGSADWIIPEGTSADPITGEPGQKIKYRVGPKGEKPEKVAGLPLNSSIFQFIQMIDRDFEELASTYDALKGQIPKGLKAFSGLKLLTERGYSQHSELIQNWEDFNRKITMHQLEIARSHFTEPRLRTIENKNGGWETKEFSKADLQGAVDVQVEAGSSTPKSQAAEQALILELIEMQLLDMNNPATHYKAMERLGQADLMAGVDIDVKDASREWKDFAESVEDFTFAKEQGDDIPQASFKLRFREEIDNNQIHYLDHVNRAKTPEFFNLPQEAQDEWVQHAEMHKMALMKQAQAQARPAMPPPPPSRGPSRMNSLEARPAEAHPAQEQVAA